MKYLVAMLLVCSSAFAQEPLTKEQKCKQLLSYIEPGTLEVFFLRCVDDISHECDKPEAATIKNCRAAVVAGCKDAIEKLKVEVKEVYKQNCSK